MQESGGASGASRGQASKRNTLQPFSRFTMHFDRHHQMNEWVFLMLQRRVSEEKSKLFPQVSSAMWYGQVSTALAVLNQEASAQLRS